MLLSARGRTTRSPSCSMLLLDGHEVRILQGGDEIAHERSR